MLTIEEFDGTAGRVLSGVVEEFEDGSMTIASVEIDVTVTAVALVVDD